MAKKHFRSNYLEVNINFDCPYWGCVCIPLTKGYHALIDVDDFYSLPKNLWHTKTSNGLSYAATWVKNQPQYLHRLIMNASNGMVCDHVNGNTMDNRKSNLRICTVLESNRNRGSNKNVYKGIKKMAASIWQARIFVNRKNINLGVFENEDLAVIAYNNAALEHFGKFARLNTLAPFTEEKQGMFVLLWITFSSWDGALKQKAEIATFKTLTECHEAAKQFPEYSNHKTLCVKKEAAHDNE